MSAGLGYETDSLMTGMVSKRQLDVFFSPKSIAVIGATDKPGHLCRTLMWNLMSSGSERTIYAVNNRRSTIFGMKSYPSVLSIGSPVELAVILTPAESVPAVMRECAQAGVRGAIVLSAGFRETGQRGLSLECETLACARAAGIRLIGPNCMGIMCPHSELNATISSRMALPGKVAVISQSGTMCAAILDWTIREHVGLSALISVGSMADVGWGSLIDYLGDDPRTRSIVLYMESIGDTRSFLSAAREVALEKPIIVIKPGRTREGSRAAASHTGALTVSDDVLDAAFRRVGVLRVNTIADVFCMTEVLGQQPRPNGPRLAIVTNAGGPGVIATDALLGAGGQLAPLSSETLSRLDDILPPHWSHGNPVDIIGDAGPERYEKTVELVARDPNVDGVLVILVPQSLADSTAIAEKLQRFAHLPGKPMLVSWMDGLEDNKGQNLLSAAGIPTFPFPDTAACTFQSMWQYSYNLHALYETPTLVRSNERSSAKSKAVEFIEGIKASGRTLLSEWESKQLLSMYGIPAVDTRPAATEDEAVALASRIGYPVAVKLNSYTVTHKEDIDGVHLYLNDKASVRNAWRCIKSTVESTADPDAFSGVTVQSMVLDKGYELILGSTSDPQFGPVLLFGTGGRLTEVMRDTAVALPPLNSTLALRLIERTKMSRALKAAHDRGLLDLPALQQLLVMFSDLITELRWIKEIEINPLLAAAGRFVCLDARVILHDPGLTLANLPRPAIRPYPEQYVAEMVASDGTKLTIRPIRPEDEPMMVRFQAGLSERSVYFRYMNAQTLANRTVHERLFRGCFIDYDRQMALIAERTDPSTGQPELLGVIQLLRAPLGNDAELALAVSDAAHRRGIGLELARHLIRFARDEKIARVTAFVLMENRAMHGLLEQAGFTFRHSSPGEPLEAELNLST